MKTVDQLIEEIKGFMPSHIQLGPNISALIEAMAVVMWHENLTLQRKIDYLQVKVDANLEEE